MSKVIKDRSKRYLLQYFEIPLIYFEANYLKETGLYIFDVVSIFLD